MEKAIQLFFLVLMLGLLMHPYGYGQQKKKPAAKRKVAAKDQMRIKTPKIKYKQGTKGSVRASEKGHFEIPSAFAGRWVDTMARRNPNNFVGNRRLVQASEDTSTFLDGEQSIVEVAEEIGIDSIWIKTTGYYAVWDAYRIDPYRIDITKFNDSLTIELYDSSDNRNWSLPLKKTQITSEFGPRWARWHYGTDLDLNTGDSVISAFDGVVRITAYDGSGYGNYVLVRHYNGLETLYAHLKEFKSQVGDPVKAGDLLGLGGSTGRSTGPHLHFEIRYQGYPINPIDVYDFPRQTIRNSKFVISPETFYYINRGRVPATSSVLAGQKVKYRKTYLHPVRQGDTLYSISIKYGVSVNQLMKLNKLRNTSDLRAGTKLRIR
jgi:murein DD-endopeptidase MepM/ murein hydrolase activator NlpD